MGKTNVYSERKPFFVQLKIISDLIYYGFLTNIDTAEGQKLGHNPVTGELPALGQAIVFGANTPKPTRMRTPDGVVSFVATASIPTAKAAKCKVVKAGKRYRYSAAKSNFAIGGTGSCNLYVPIEGIKYLTFPVKLSNPDAATRTTVTPLSVKRVRVKWMCANFHRGSMMNSSTLKNFSSCQLGDARLNSRALEIGQALCLQYGQPLSQVFPSKKKLKRAYEFFANPKTDLKKVAEPHWKATTCSMTGLKTVLAVGDTTYLDYKKIIKKREEYGPIGNGGNGLILQSTLAVEADFGQPLGLLWQKIWHREAKTKPLNETATQKKIRQAQERKIQREKPFEDKESYRWVEAIKEVKRGVEELAPQRPKLPFIHPQNRVVHVFDREGDIAEVFAEVKPLKNIGVLVRAAHNRCLSGENAKLWGHLEAQTVQFYQEIKVSKNHNQPARMAKIAVSFCKINLQPPARLKGESLGTIYAVYAREIDAPPEVKPISWMLLTTEPVTNITEAETILRWYTYRWHIEEYHKILKSGTQAESYRLAGESMETLLGFLTAIAAELLKITYLNRTQPHADATTILTPIQLDVLKALTPKLPKVLNVKWAVESIARLGGYLEHRKGTVIGIQVLWRGLSKLSSLCMGWQLAKQT